ncbi:hypothetical protein SAMN05421890_4859 [Ensifer adhaerens]|nr:hypothetical protein SAMN05421890_4859 [Ensifer adhaerens]
MKRSPNVQQQRWDSQPFFFRYSLGMMRFSAYLFAIVLIARCLSELTVIPFHVFFILLMTLVIFDAWQRAKRRWGLPEKRDGE